MYAKKKKRERKHQNHAKDESGRLYYNISVPISHMRALRWQDGQKVVVKKYGKGLIIRDWPDKKRK